MKTILQSIIKVFFVFFFIGLWVFLIFLHIYYQKDGFFTLRYPHYNRFTKSSFNTELLKGEKFSGELVAKENYLGIIAFRFNTFSRVNKDIIVFRLKEKGSNSWYYEREYKTKRIYPSKFYTIGFPKITNSKGKTYDFEMESLSGKPGDAVAIEDQKPALISKYEIPRSLIVKNPKSLISFLQKKFILAITDKDYFFAFIIYLFPLLFYLGSIIYYDTQSLERKKAINSAFKERHARVKLFFLFLVYTKYILIYLILAALLVDVLFIKEQYDLVILVILALFIITAYLYKIGTDVIFFFSILLIAITAIMTLAGDIPRAEKFAFWSYVLMWYGCIQLLFNLKFTPKNQLHIKQVRVLLHTDIRRSIKAVKMSLHKVLQHF